MHVEHVLQIVRPTYHVASKVEYQALVGRTHSGRTYMRICICSKTKFVKIVVQVQVVQVAAALRFARVQGLLAKGTCLPLKMMPENHEDREHFKDR